MYRECVMHQTVNWEQRFSSETQFVDRSSCQLDSSQSKLSPLVERDSQVGLNIAERVLRHFDPRNYCSFAGFGMIIMCKAYIRPKGFGVWGLGFGVWGL